MISDSSLCAVDLEAGLVSVCMCFYVFLRADVVVGPLKPRLQRGNRERGVSNQRHGACLGPEVWRGRVQSSSVGTATLAAVAQWPAPSGIGPVRRSGFE